MLIILFLIIKRKTLELNLTSNYINNFSHKPNKKIKITTNGNIQLT